MIKLVSHCVRSRFTSNGARVTLGGRRNGFVRHFTEEAGAAATKSTEKNKSSGLGLRIAGFTGVVGIGGLATFAYMLTSNEDFLFQVHDYSPALVDRVAPWLGLPVVGETGVFDVDAFPPRDISQLVGDRVFVAAILRSGHVCIVEADANASPEEVDRVVREQLNVPNLVADPIVEVQFLDDEEGQELKKQDQNTIQKTFGLQLPPIPAVGEKTKQQLKLLLNIYRTREFDLKTTLELQKQSGQDSSATKRGLQTIDQGKKQIKELIKITKF